MIQGIHHIAIKCKDEANFKEALHFYCDLLGMKLVRTWDQGPQEKAMVDTGSGMLEIFASGFSGVPEGAFQHLAFAVDSVEAHLEPLRAAGYEVIMEPKDIAIGGGEKPLPARIGFVRGPVGEWVEFFHEK